MRQKKKKEQTNIYEIYSDCKAKKKSNEWEHIDITI